MLRIIKIGGSLLDWPELRDGLSQFLQQLTPPGAALIVVGGGAIVNAVRDYDRIQNLHQVDCHWLCVDLMHSTARLLQMLFPQWPVLDSSAMLDDWLESGANLSSVAIVSPLAYYSRTLNSDCLPISWDTTSDSISGLLARIVRADELILLKSSSEALETIVDCSFASTVAPKLNFRIVNLRLRS